MSELDNLLAAGWVEWAGGGCPLGEHVVVNIRFRDGTRWALRSAGSLARENENFWRHDPSSPEGDIIAYRVVRA